MLENKIRTPEETEAYLRELKEWIHTQEETEAEEMSAFFTKRLARYEEVHLGNWGELYAHIADFFDDGLETLLDIGCGTGLELEAVYRRFPDAALSFETFHHFSYEKKGQIYEKLFQSLKNGGYYMECDYVACCQEEEALCMERLARARRRSTLPEDVFLHIDTPLTLEHQVELMERAGFRVRVLHQNEGTVVFRADKAETQRGKRGIL